MVFQLQCGECNGRLPERTGLRMLRKARGVGDQRGGRLTGSPNIETSLSRFRSDRIWKKNISHTRDCHICRSVGVVWGVNVGIYGSPMECMGMEESHPGSWPPPPFRWDVRGLGWVAGAQGAGNDRPPPTDLGHAEQGLGQSMSPPVDPRPDPKPLEQSGPESSGQGSNGSNQIPF